MTHVGPERRISIVVRVSVRSRCPSTVTNSYRRRKLTVPVAPETVVRGSRISTPIWLACLNSSRMAILGVAAQAGPHTLQRVEIARFERGLVASQQLRDTGFRIRRRRRRFGRRTGRQRRRCCRGGAAGGAAGAGTGWFRSGAGGAGCGGEAAGLVVGGGGASAAAGFSVFSGAGGAEAAARARTSRAVLSFCAATSALRNSPLAS